MSASEGATLAESVRDHFAHQFWVTTRQQLSEIGCDWNVVERQIAGGRWRPLNESVVALHNGPLTPEQRQAAVVLSVTGLAALCGLTCASTRGLGGHESDVVHVLVVRGDRVLAVQDVRMHVHESRRFTAKDVTTNGFPPMVSLDRAVIDAAVWSKQPRDAVRLVTAAVQQRLTTAARLSSELASAGRVRHSALLRSVLADVEGGAQALSEIALVRFCRRHRLPKPVMQVRMDSGGRRRYLDARLKAPSGRAVALEIDGGVHLTLTQRWRDTAKDNDASLDGVLTLRFPSVAIYLDDPLAVRQIRRALGLVSGTPSI